MTDPEAERSPGDPPPKAAPSRLRGPIGAVRERLAASLGEPEQLLAILLVLAFALRAAWITIPERTLIFDEAYYVNAARVILGLPMVPGDHYASDPAGLDPNDEHPPLGKVAMAATMAVFGDNGLGWRLPSIIASIVALLALYLVVRAAGGSERLALLALFLFGFDNLAFVHGRIGT